VLGVKGSQVATVCYIVAAVLALLGIAGLIHAFRTPKSVGFATPEASSADSSGDTDLRRV
jgi:hypothetical protein